MLTCCLAAPTSWQCDPDFYDTHDGCDCECGIPDPDCNYNDTIIYGCTNGTIPTCINGNWSYSGPTPPSSWTCSLAFYSGQDGCDCNCGAFDPDCLDIEQVVLNCPRLEDICSDDGTCLSNYSIPSVWVCPSSYYAGNDGCDCNCVAEDPDCELDSSIIFGCPCDLMSCYEGFCEGMCNGYEIVVSKQISSATPSFHSLWMLVLGVFFSQIDAFAFVSF